VQGYEQDTGGYISMYVASRPSFFYDVTHCTFCSLHMILVCPAKWLVFSDNCCT